MSGSKSLPTDTSSFTDASSLSTAVSLYDNYYTVKPEEFGGILKVAIIGAGAIGSLFGWFFHRGGDEVWFLDIHPDRVTTIRHNGISIEGISGEHRFQPEITLEPDEIGTADLILVTVKSYDTEAAARSAARLLSGRSYVLTLQNGLGNLEKIAAQVGEDRTLGGTTAQGSTLLEHGKIRHAGRGETVIGELSGPPGDRVGNVVETLIRGQVEARPTDNLTGVIWGKLLVNAGINPLTAITGLKNGQLIEHAGTRQILQAAVREGAFLARAKGIQIPYSDAVEKTESVCAATAGNISSMLQDVLKRKKTEVASINGALVEESKILGIETPVNATLTYLVQTIDASYESRVRSL